MIKRSNKPKDLYLHIPKCLFTEKDISLTDAVVFCLLNQAVQNNENPSQKELSDTLQITDRTVRTSLYHLEEMGFLKINRSGRHNSYEILR